MDDEAIIGYDALYESMLKCKRGVMWKDSVAHFALNGPECVLNLEKQLHDGSYTPRPPKIFTITSPKEREISSIAFRDRVYQRSLNDNILYPVMTNSFIYDNWACQQGKGTDGARKRLEEFFHEFFRKYCTDGYLAQFDIHGYYRNMDHKLTEDMFREGLKAKNAERAYERLEANLHHQYRGDKGYNPGSQMIQIAGVSFLNELDHYIKEELHIHFYIRYMDDFILMHHDKEYLEMCKQKIIEKLRAIKLEINPKKTVITPIKNGVMFLGFQYRLTDTGKVIMLINPKNVKAKRKNLRRLVAKSKRGLLPKESVDESYRSWRDHASKGNSYKLLQKMDEYYKSLWKEEDYADNQTQKIST